MAPATVTRFTPGAITASLGLSPLSRRSAMPLHSLFALSRASRTDAAPCSRIPRSRIALAAGALLLAAATAAAQSPLVHTPAIDPAVLIRAADIAYSQELARARKEKTLNVDRGLAARAHHDAEPLISYSRDILPAAARWGWHLSVEARPEAIAYCLPGGKIIVTSALFDRLKLTDDEFSAVVAHVVAHALIGKDTDAAVAAYQRERGRTTPDPDTNRAALELADALRKVLLSEHYDAAAERAADDVALELMARSGVNPAVAAGAWRKVGQAGAGSAPELGALHPVTPERIAALEAQAAVVAPLYQKALAGRPPAQMAPPMPRR